MTFQEATRIVSQLNDADLVKLAREAAFRKASEYSPYDDLLDIEREFNENDLEVLLMECALRINNALYASAKELEAIVPESSAIQMLHVPTSVAEMISVIPLPSMQQHLHRCSYGAAIEIYRKEVEGVLNLLRAEAIDETGRESH